MERWLLEAAFETMARRAVVLIADIGIDSAKGTFTLGDGRTGTAHIFLEPQIKSPSIREVERRKRSPEARAKMAESQRKRWAAQRGNPNGT